SSAAAEGVSSSGRSGARRRAAEAAARGARRRDSILMLKPSRRPGWPAAHPPGAAVGFEATAAVPPQGITMTKPTTHQRDLVKLPRALAPLIERPQWAVWRWTQKLD